MEEGCIAKTHKSDGNTVVIASSLSTVIAD
jgi:hypothetical protein